MLNHRSLSRRTALKASGTGALALSLPTGVWTPVATAAVPDADDAPAALRRSTWTALIGQPVELVGGPQLRVDAVADLRTLKGRDDAFSVILSAPAGSAPESGVHLVRAGDDEPLGLFIGRVGPAGMRAELELVVDRTRALPRAAAAAAPLTEPLAEQTAEHTISASSAEAPGAAAIAAGVSVTQAPGESIVRGRRRVHATGRRTASGVALRLEFPGGGVRAVKVRLLSGERVVATGGTVVRRGVAATTLRVRRGKRLARGSYRLELQLTDPNAASTTIERAVTLR